MKFREVKTSQGTVTSVQHLSGGRFIKTINDLDRLWSDYLKEKTEEHLADPIISDPHIPTFEENKAQRISSVDIKSTTMRKAGFIYDSTTFSMEEKDENGWKDLLLGSEAGLLMYPISVYAVNLQGKALADSASVKSFCTSFMIARESILESGRIIKAQLELATNQAELDAIEDNR